MIMPVTQRDLAHVNNMNNEIDLMIQVGNAGIGSTKVTVDGNVIKDPGANDIFNDSFNLDLGSAQNLINKKIEIETKISPNPAISDKSMILSYDLTNATFFTGKTRTLKVSSSAGLPSETFFVTITLM
jgi:hypothetical protein